MGWLDDWFNGGWFGITSSVEVIIGAQTVTTQAVPPSPTALTSIQVSPGPMTINSLSLGTSISAGLSIQSGVLGNNFLPAPPSVVAASSVKPEVLGAGFLLSPPSVGANALVNPGLLNNNLSLYNLNAAGNVLVNPGLLTQTMAVRGPAVNLGAALSLAAMNVNFKLISPEGSGCGQVFLEPVVLDTDMSPIIFKTEVRLNIDPVVGFLGVAQRKTDVIIDI
jgi:hypothetical protein